ncbi:type I secretion system ATPase [Leptothrix cholodnii SP-6]|uniref:Type I secretion system ATPase n=1 Tax=Leptothrix cholodnii (strain ATCC 51168 / LMG 8142 / SP-6) TaxID=395495 RepID=B1XZ09_LEPCP|nr:type I secretion system permease/ATPase [Leptothrix cholodnii]ACB34028.1 type I secretion system ATPase [Leptothrix cholodnii SP-6]
MKSLLRTVAGFSMAINLLWLGPALFSLQVFDRVLTSQSQETLLVLLLGLAIALVLVGALDFLRGRLQGVLGNIVNDAMAPEIARLSLAVAARRQGAFTNEALRDVGRLRALFSSQGLVAVMDAPWALIFIAVIAVANLWLGLAALLSAVLMLGLAYANDRMTKQSIEKLQKDAGASQRFLDQAMVNAEVAQAMGMADALVGRWNALSAKVADLQDPVAQRSVAMASATRIARQLTQVLMTALGAWLVIRGEATPGVLIASNMLLGRALQPVEQIVGSWKIMAEGRLAWRRLDPLMSEAFNRRPQMALPAPNGQLSTTGLVFRPQGSERTLLMGVSIRLEAGESLAILGPSGAGKSTLVRLLIGLWAPSQGHVRLDGVDLSRWTREQIGPHIGYMPQDVELFAGSVADNIARMGPVDPGLVVEAAQLAGVHELVLGLPDGYDTQVDPNAALLSPGQRQRIALARALYGNPKLVVLDEPNANLDGAGELALAETLKRLQGKATVVVVTHRQTLTQHVHKMLVIEGGRQTHFGRTDEVLAALRGGHAPAGGQVVSLARAAQAAQAAQAAPAAQAKV